MTKFESGGWVNPNPVKETSGECIMRNSKKFSVYFLFYKKKQYKNLRDMINLRNVKRLCKEFESIENYQEAVNSPEIWDCHHRNEIDMNLSAEELKKMDLYYNRPASELIFLTHENHTSLHMKGKKPSIYGKHHSEEIRNKISDSLKGVKHPRYKHICPALLQMTYVEQKKSAYKMAQELGIARVTIIKRLREHNIPIRKI